MSIPGPAYTTASDNQPLDTRMVSQRFRVSGGDRGLESFTARLWRLSNLLSPNLITNANFAADPFLTSGSQVWEAWGGPLPTWAAGFVQLAVTAGTHDITTTRFIKTQVKNRKSNPMTLQPGDSLETIISVTSNVVRDIIVRVYDGSGQQFTQTFPLPADSVSHDYTLTGTATRWWREVWVEISSTGTGGANSVQLTNVSVKHQAQLTSPVRCALYTDDNNLPGVRVSQSSTTFSPHTDLTNTPADYSFDFPDEPLLTDGEYYHMVVYVDAPDLDNYFDHITTGQMVWIIRHAFGASYADGTYTEWVYGNAAGTWAMSFGADLYFEVFYTDVVPDAPDYPLVVQWPCDCNAQVTVVNDVVEIIDAKLNALLAVNQPQMELNVDEEPGLGLWGTRWIKDDGTLPLPDWVNMLWRKDDEDIFGGHFTSYDGAVVRMEREDRPMHPYNDMSPATSQAGSLQNFNNHNDRNRITFTLTVEYDSYLYFGFLAFYSAVAAAADVRWTYWVNGVNEAVTEIGGFATNRSDAGYDLTPPPPGTYPTTAGNMNRKVLHPTILTPGSYSFEIVFWCPVGGGVANAFKAGPIVADGAHAATKTNLILELIRA